MFDGAYMKYQGKPWLVLHVNQLLCVLLSSVPTLNLKLTFGHIIMFDGAYMKYQGQNTSVKRANTNALARTCTTERNQTS